MIIYLYIFKVSLWLLTIQTTFYKKGREFMSNQISEATSTTKWKDLTGPLPFRMRNDRTGQLYSGKFSISVVDLKHINLATTDDQAQHRDLWASFFKAKSWEELTMLAKQDSNIEKAVFAVHTLTQDERFRQQCEAREDFLRQQIDHDAWFENKFKEQEATISKQEITIAEQASTITELRETVANQDITIDNLNKTVANQDTTIDNLNKTVANQGATITSLQTTMEELRKMVAALQSDNK
jgi:uncharacterized coiled-coil protein SlyX